SGGVPCPRPEGGPARRSQRDRPRGVVRRGREEVLVDLETLHGPRRIPASRDIVEIVQVITAEFLWDLEVAPKVVTPGLRPSKVPEIVSSAQHTKPLLLTLEITERLGNGVTAQERPGVFS